MQWAQRRDVACWQSWQHTEAQKGLKIRTMQLLIITVKADGIYRSFTLARTHELLHLTGNPIKSYYLCFRDEETGPA